MRSKRSLLIGGSVILLCLCLIFGATYALFTDEERVSNHLVAGDLDVVLQRTYLEYSVLDEDGYFPDPAPRLETPVDFSNVTMAEKNIFGLDSENLLIVPGSYFDAGMKIINNADTAFDYAVSLYMTGDFSELADQLKITVTGPDGKTTDYILSEMDDKDAPLFTGHLAAAKAGTESATTFSVKVTFIDDVAEGITFDNDDAKDNSVTFDLVVSAVQQTKRPA